MQTIIVMSISYILSKEMPSETRLCKSIWCQIQCLNYHKPEYRYMIYIKCILNLLLTVFIMWYAYNRIQSKIVMFYENNHDVKIHTITQA